MRVKSCNGSFSLNMKRHLFDGADLCHQTYLNSGVKKFDIFLPIFYHRMDKIWVYYIPHTI